MKRFAFLCALVLATGFVARAEAQAPNPAAGQLDRLQRADGAKVVPEKFLRSWDPVTLFFDRDLGPQSGGPEDAPERFVTMQPAVAGAWQWLGPRALQFRPADAWKPLQSVTIRAEGLSTRLIPLLPVPISSKPADQADGITDLDQISLTFADPVDLAVLARLLTIELRPSPGISGSGGQFLTAQDFSLQALERANRDDNQTIVVRLKTAVPDGRVAILRLKLSNEPGLDDPTYELRLRSAVPFTVTGASCGRGLEHETLDGVMRCLPTGASDDDGDGRNPRRRIALTFSSKPEALDVVRARDVLRITPAVDDLAVEPDGNRLQLTGRFLADTVYELHIAPGSIQDMRHRPFSGAAFVQRFAFAAPKPRLKWDANQGIVERLGPQLVPLRGGGYDKVDVRIHAIDALSRDFWPFPSGGVETQDDAAPPLPGNEPAPWSATEDAKGDAIAERIKALGSPAVSELVTLPIQRNGAAAKFGLDLKPLLTKIAGAGQPGAYLIGMRTVDGAKRRWLRVQVTDLTLSTVEESERVIFAVTSLSTARPIGEAQVRLEGVRDDKFVTLANGTTDADGMFVWSVADRTEGRIKRIVVTKGLDTLVLEPERGPSEYARENWTKPESAWLSWTVDPAVDRSESERTLCHIFTERPIYRPE